MNCDDSQEAHKQRWGLQHALNKLRFPRPAPVMLLFLAFLVRPAWSQESPYVVTYDHYLEEPGNLEVEYFSNFGTQRGGNDFHAYWLELEYGATAWWTTELYLDGQTTFNDSTIFTGFLAGRTGSIPSGVSISSTRCFIWSTNRSAKPTRSSRRSRATTSKPTTRTRMPQRVRGITMNWNSSCCSRRLSTAGMSP